MPKTIGNTYAKRLDDALQVARERAARTGKPVYVWLWDGLYRLNQTANPEGLVAGPVITVNP